MSSSYNSEVIEILNQALDIAQMNQHEYLLAEHLLFSLLNYKPFFDVLITFGVDVDSMITDVGRYLATITQTGTAVTPKRTQVIDRIFNRVTNKAILSNQQYIPPIDLFVSIAAETKTQAHYFIVKYDIDINQLVDHWEQYYKNTKMNSKNAAQEKANKILTEYCRNLNEAAKNGELEPLIGREQEIIDAVDILAKKFKMNVLMIGDPGTGKTAICEGLAQRIVAGKVPDFLKDRTIWCLEIGSLVAGTRYRGDFEKKINEVVQALEDSGNCILFMDEAHAMHGAGNSSNNNLDLANMLKPVITRGKMMVIANTTWEDYYESFEKDRALMRRFFKLVINEPDRDTNIEILTGVANRLENFHNVVIDKTAIVASVDLSTRYIFDRKNPDKSIDILDAACAKQRALNNSGVTIDKLNVVEQVSKLTKIPESKLLNKQTDKLCNLKPNIYSKLFGQEDAVEKVVDTIYVGFSGLSETYKPVGSFLFTGPTGTGKTELCKLLAEYLDMNLIRFDMSEFMEKHTVSRLIGAPPGYIGFDDGQMGGGQLISAISKEPYSILLLDEIEKANEDVFNILLQIMDEGRVSSSNGKTVNMSNCIVIMTTNLGAEANETNNIGFVQSLTRTGEEDNAIKKFFRPEFRNRLSATVKFNKLSTDVVRKVVAKFLNMLKEDLKSRNIQLKVDEDVITYLVKTGYDDKMGARPLSRKIDTDIKIPLSKKILFEELHDTVLELKMKNDGIIIEPSDDSTVASIVEENG